jgi:RHS repeat-associated protein
VNSVNRYNSELHQVVELANSLNSSGLAASLYDDGRRSRDSGKERDPEPGLDYFGARYYGSALGRFTSPDPVGGIDPYDPQSWNAYAYGRNNPLVYTDPTGESYQICDANGNCTQKDGLTDEEFASEKKAGEANGEHFDNGSLYHFDSSGAKVVDGSYTQTDVDIDGSAAGNQAGAQKIGSNAAFVNGLTYLIENFLTAGMGNMEGPMPGSLGNIQPPSGPAPSSKYEDLTEPGSVSNRGTNVPKAEFEKNLSSSEWAKSTSKDGQVSIYTKNGARYVVRDFSKSGNKGPTADYYAPGSKSIDLTIRLQ